MPQDSEYFYYCKLFKVSDYLTNKSHIYKWELIMPASKRINIQHVQVYECDSDYEGEPNITSGNCYSSLVFSNHCQKASINWFLGADTVSATYNLFASSFIISKIFHRFNIFLITAAILLVETLTINILFWKFIMIIYPK